MEYISTSMMHSNNTTLNTANNCTTTNTTTTSVNNLSNNYENGFGLMDTSSRIDMTSELETTNEPVHLNHTSNHHTFIADADLSQLSLEIEKERNEYQEKSRHLHQQLEAFRHEIDDLKVDDNVTTMDRIHREQQDQGNTKYSTIQKIKRGSTQSRVEIFEEL